MSRPAISAPSKYVKLDSSTDVQKRLPTWPPDQDEIAESVVRAISSGHWARYSNGMNAVDGSPHQLLCESVARVCRCRHVRLVSSGTAAVELALRACRVGPEDEVILSAYDYPGNLRCISAVGASPVMVDIEPHRWTVDPQQVADSITPKTRAILISHLYQNMAAVAELREIADKAAVYLIEDACQSPGSKIGASTIEPKFAGTVGHIGTLSFGGSKLLSAGNGGAIITDDDRLSQRLIVALERPSDTFPLSQLQAAALLPQFQTLDYWNRKRQEGAQWLTDQLSKLSSRQTPNRNLFLPVLNDGDSTAALYKFAFFTLSAEERDKLLARVRALGIPCGHGFPCFGRRSTRTSQHPRSFPNAMHAAETTVVIDHRVLIAEQGLREEIVNEIGEVLR